MHCHTEPCLDATVMDLPHPTHHGSPPLWGWGRLQVAPVTPYTPEPTIPPSQSTLLPPGHNGDLFLAHGSTNSSNMLQWKQPSGSTAGAGHSHCQCPKDRFHQQCWCQLLACCRAVCKQAALSLLPPPPRGLNTRARVMPPTIPGEHHGGASRDRDTSQRLQCNPICTLLLSQVVSWNPAVPTLQEGRARISVHLPVPAHWHQERRDPQGNAVGT